MEITVTGDINGSPIICIKGESGVENYEEIAKVFKRIVAELNKKD